MGWGACGGVVRVYGGCRLWAYGDRSVLGYRFPLPCGVVTVFWVTLVVQWFGLSRVPHILPIVWSGPWLGDVPIRVWLGWPFCCKLPGLVVPMFMAFWYGSIRERQE